MNSLDDFAAMRPDVDPIGDGDLDRLWNEITAPGTPAEDESLVHPVSASPDTSDAPIEEATFDFVEERSPTPIGSGRRRRSIALIGAAAAMLLGVVGTVIVLAGRSDEADPFVDQPTVSAPVSGPVATTRSVDPALGVVPQWRITEPGWELTEFAEVSNYPEGTKLWAAVTVGDAAGGWVLVYPSSLDLDPPIAEAGDQTAGVLGRPSVEVDRVPSDPANLSMNWGGYPLDEAPQSALVALGRDDSSNLSSAALDPAGAYDMTRTWRYAFTGPDGEVVRVEVSGGGVPYFEDFFAMDLIEGGGVVDGIDDPGFLAAAPARVVGRTGFWVTTIESDSPVTSSDWSARLIDLVQLVPDDERIESAPEPVVEPAAIIVGADVLGPLPDWTVDAPGWAERTSVPDPIDPGIDGFRLFVNAEAPGDSWISMDPSEITETVPPTNLIPQESAGGVTSQIIERDGSLFTLDAGGVTNDQAIDVITALDEGEALPFGFVEISPDDLAAVAQTTTTEFGGPDGLALTVEVLPGGRATFAQQTDGTTTRSGTEHQGVDESVVRVVGDDVSVVARTGFWVSTITVSGAPNASFDDLAALVQLRSSQVDPVEAMEELDSTASLEAIAIGDSVMLGAANELTELGLMVDAVESRVFSGAVELVGELGEQERLPNTLVVAVGTNGTIARGDMDEFVRLVANVETVVLVTMVETGDFAEANNDLIFDAADVADNITVFEWDRFATTCPGVCFFADGIHLTPTGAEFYTGLLAAWIGA